MTDIKSTSLKIAEDGIKQAVSTVADIILMIEEQFDIKYGNAEIEVEIADGRRIALKIIKAELPASNKENFMAKKAVKKVAKKKASKKVAKKKAPAKKAKAAPASDLH